MPPGPPDASPAPDVDADRPRMSPWRGRERFPGHARVSNYGRFYAILSGLGFAQVADIAQLVRARDS